MPFKVALMAGEFVLPKEGNVTRFIKKAIDQSITGEEAYRLLVTPEGINLTAGTECGLFRGGQTIKQLVQTSGGTIPCLEIEDQPRFRYRGFHIDSSRHMQTVDNLKRMIDAAALFKFNAFHWHLCDDQGFRFMSERYPLLNEIGSYRDGDNFGSLKSAGRYGGFYTKDEMREIVAYCKEQFIDMIPEIEIPGHASALLASYPDLSCDGKGTDIKKKAGIFKDILCAGKEETYTFLTNLLDEVMELFPSKYIHLGGDEAPKKNWKNCPHCQSKMKENALGNEDELQAYLINRIHSYIKSHGKTSITWNESLASGKLDREIAVQMWMDKQKRCVDFANAGGKIIISDFFSYYVDYPYGMTSLKKTYRYEPLPEGLHSGREDSVLGVEAALWTEYITNFDQMAWQCYPRMAAIAESGWSPPDKKDLADFMRRMYKITHILKEMGVVPAPPKEWNPGPLKKLATLVAFFKVIYDPEMLRFVFQNLNKKID
jgi:hexosaminidase